MLTANLVACTFMTGLIWIVQLLHYPAFAAIEASTFPKFHQMHSQRISFIVAPVMLFELVTGGLLLIYPPREPLVIISFVLLIVIWICTFTISVPLHNQLGTQKDLDKIKKLILTNWPRTILWSFRSILLLWVFYSV